MERRAIRAQKESQLEVLAESEESPQMITMFMSGPMVRQVKAPALDWLIAYRPPNLFRSIKPRTPWDKKMLALAIEHATSKTPSEYPDTSNEHTP